MLEVISKLSIKHFWKNTSWRMALLQRALHQVAHKAWLSAINDVNLITIKVVTAVVLIVKMFSPLRM